MTSEAAFQSVIGPPLVHPDEGIARGFDDPEGALLALLKRGDGRVLAITSIQRVGKHWARVQEL